jgi:DNA invertase Pin-like site-specific DNA recombinase
MGALAEFERDLIRERANAGLAAARARGRVGGRPRKLATNGKVALAQRLFAARSIPLTIFAQRLGFLAQPCIAMSERASPASDS